MDTGWVGSATGVINGSAVTAKTYQSSAKGSLCGGVAGEAHQAPGVTGVVATMIVSPSVSIVGFLVMTVIVSASSCGVVGMAVTWVSRGALPS